MFLIKYIAIFGEIRSFIMGNIVSDALNGSWSGRIYYKAAKGFEQLGREKIENAQKNNKSASLYFKKFNRFFRIISYYFFIARKEKCTWK